MDNPDCCLPGKTERMKESPDCALDCEARKLILIAAGQAQDASAKQDSMRATQFTLNEKKQPWEGGDPSRGRKVTKIIIFLIDRGSGRSKFSRIWLPGPALAAKIAHTSICGPDSSMGVAQTFGCKRDSARGVVKTND